MARYTAVAICAVFCGLLVLITGTASGAKKGEKPDPARDAVEKVLLREADSAVDRRAELAKALERQPESELLRWQMGYVRVGKSWRSFEDVGEPPTDTEKVSEYRRRRDQAPATAAGQLELANWCRQHRLRDQERAHLMNVLGLSPGQEDPAVFERLGYRRVGNQWLSHEQLSEWRDSNQRTLAALKKWEPQLMKIAEQSSGAPKRREAALLNLQKIASVDAIPALEYILSGASEPAALLAVEAFRGITDYEGTVALAKQAVFSKWSSVRTNATAALRYRELDQFVPAMISLLAAPATSVASTPRLYFLVDSWREGTRSGAFVLVSSYLVARETDDQFQVSVLNSLDFRLNERLNGELSRLPGSSPGRGTMLTSLNSVTDNSALLRAQLDLSRDLETVKEQREKELSAINQRTQELNGRIIEALAAVSGRSANPEPSSWWRWWEQQSDTEQATSKPLNAAYEEEIQGDPTARVYATPLRLASCECFAAGTPVWTDRGPMRIEQIKIGDSVLSQDVETGALAYKPVLATSVRQPKELVQLVIGKETVTSTGGHRYWLSGKGWVKVRDLQPNSRLHTVTGNAVVVSTDTAPAAKTYNLVVADSHSYFVGETGLLVQDLPMPRSTNQIVPGLVRDRIAAGKLRP